MDSAVTLYDVRIVKVTGKAVLIKHPDLDDNIWIPLSQVDRVASEDLEEGEVISITISHWIAKKHNLE